MPFGLKRRVVLLVATGVVLLATAISLVVFYRQRELDPLRLVGRLPAGEAALLAVDFQALRRAGILALLAGGTVEAEPEYKDFVAKTRFDYARDLDRAFASFHSRGVFLLLRGRFDWSRLESYAREQGGSCFNTLCRMAGSAPERRVSFFPLRPNLMALAVSPDDWAAARLNEEPRPEPSFQPPQQPLWLRLPPATLQKAETFPTGTQLFAKALAGSESVLLTLGATPGSQGFEARLDVLCRGEDEAARLTATLQKITRVLTDLLAKEKTKPGPGDLATVLSSGVFRQERRRVLGRWPIERAFLEGLAGRS